MRSLFLASSLAAGLLSFSAWADGGTCACGRSNEQCQQMGCTCGAAPDAQCPVHGKHAMGPGMMGMHRGMMGGPMAQFDPKTVTSVKGTVAEVVRVDHGNGFVGTHLKVKVGAEVLVVHVGPQAFIDPKMTFAAGDAIEATGSRITFQNEPTLLATTVKKGGKTVEIRKPDGTPLFTPPPAMQHAM